jgi:hypothetical protein
MAIIEWNPEWNEPVVARPQLRVIETPQPVRNVALRVELRRVARERMMRRRRRTLVVATVMVLGFFLFVGGPLQVGPQGAGADLSGISVTDTPSVVTVTAGMDLHDIAAQANPADPAGEYRALVAELGTSTVVPGERVQIP